MIEIKDLLQKWGELLNKEGLKTEVLREVIGEVIGVKIKAEDITLKNNIIYLNIKPVFKSEILLKKEEIFSRLQSALGRKTPEDIR